MSKHILALWKKQSKEGKDFLSGELDLGALGTVSLAVFPNENKTEDKHPDYRGIISEPPVKPVPSE